MQAGRQVKRGKVIVLCSVYSEYNWTDLQCLSMHVYPEVNPTEFSGNYCKVTVPKEATKVAIKLTCFISDPIIQDALYAVLFQFILLSKKYIWKVPHGKIILALKSIG